MEFQQRSATFLYWLQELMSKSEFPWLGSNVREGEGPGFRLWRALSRILGNMTIWDKFEHLRHVL